MRTAVAIVLILVSWFAGGLLLGLVLGRVLRGVSERYPATTPERTRPERPTREVSR